MSRAERLADGAPKRLLGLLWRHRLAWAFAAGAAIMVLSPFRIAILRAAHGARLHAPDLGVFRDLSVATQVHVVAALGAMALGCVIFAFRKGRSAHRLVGWVWLGLATTVAVSSFFITSLRPGHWSVLHLFSLWVLLVAPLAAIRARLHDVARHRRTVMALFFGGFVINLVFAFLPGRAMWNIFFG